MTQSLDFSEVLDAADQLDLEAQAELTAILQRRLTERGRQRIAEAVQASRAEFAAGQCQPSTAQQIVSEALT